MREVAVAGGDLFRIAAEYLDDPLQWAAVAATNGLEDFLVEGVAVLVLPEVGGA